MSNETKNLNRKEKPLLLFSCLDWGLGHTTRSLPLIKELLSLGCNLIVACNSTQKKVLEPEIPHVRFVDIPGYGIYYGNGKWRTKVEILFQLRKILTRIKAENRWLSSFLLENQVDAIVSDNRYGLFSPKVHSVLITHQLGVNTGYGIIANKIAQKFLYRFINRFNECWVPDFRKKPSLAGALSHPLRVPRIPVKYLGAFSRLEKCRDQSKRFDLLFILSGPEPQRTLLEQLILIQMRNVTFKAALIRGLPDHTGSDDLDLAEYGLGESSIEIFNHADSTSLNSMICASDLVICRAGYTSIMDLMKLQKKLVVIPTPGQPEQEYLARWLAENQLALMYTQPKFSIESALKNASTFSYKPFDQNMTEYKPVLKDFVERISS